MTTRLATLNDIPLIQQLAAEVWPATYRGIIPEAQIEYMMDRMYTTESLTEQLTTGAKPYLIAYDAGKSVGYVSYSLDYLPRTTKVHKLYVLPQGQGHGYGRSLLNAVAERAHAARQTRLRLDVNRDNPAIGFYERIGFTRVAEAVTDIGQGFVMDDFVYEIGL